MTATGWIAELKEYVAECRRENPLPDRAALSHNETLQYGITRNSVIAWTEECPEFFHDPGRVVVFTSNAPGLVAASSILGEERVFLLFRHEYESLLEQSPDEEYQFHVHLWSLFLDDLEPRHDWARQRYPLRGGSVYWQFSEGGMYGRELGEGREHLWEFDGEEAALLKEYFDEWVKDGDSEWYSETRKD